jgi:hypothetical protein
VRRRVTSTRESFGLFRRAQIAAAVELLRFICVAALYVYCGGGSLFPIAHNLESVWSRINR